MTSWQRAPKLTGSGRRIARGVLNGTAYAEMVQRGEALPVQGFADMDMMKATNDTFGHATGDEAIHAVGQALTRHSLAKAMYSCARVMNFMYKRKIRRLTMRT